MMAKSKFEQGEQGANDAYFGGGPSATDGTDAYKQGFALGREVKKKHNRTPDKGYVPFRKRVRSGSGE